MHVGKRAFILACYCTLVEMKFKCGIMDEHVAMTTQHELDFIRSTNS